LSVSTHKTSPDVLFVGFILLWDKFQSLNPVRGFNSYRWIYHRVSTRGYSCFSPPDWSSHISWIIDLFEIFLLL